MNTPEERLAEIDADLAALRRRVSPAEDSWAGAALFLRSQLSTQTERIATLEAAVKWALGELDDFPSPPIAMPGKPIRRYYWRGELRAKAFPESPT